MRSASRSARVALVLLGLSLPVAARAQDAAPEDDEAEDSGPDTAAVEEPKLVTPAEGEPAPAAARAAAVDKGHRHQFGFGLQAGVGYRAIKPYESHEYCGELSEDSGNAAACLGRTPVALDFEVTYGLSATVEALVETRVGLERDFGVSSGSSDGPRLFHVAPGARFYFADSGAVSLFTTAQLVLDLTGYAQESAADYRVRNVSGLMIDLHHAYGLYVFMGETLGFRRWLSGELEAGLGFQGRYP